MTMDLSFSFIFQSALPQGERRFFQAAITRSMDFNPRSRRGRDSSGFRGLKPRGISIRAPARGATKNETHNHPTEIISIRAPAGGATSSFKRDRHAAFNFNPRSRSGSDPSATVPSKSRSYFNPRSRSGSDRQRCSQHHTGSISIRAPAGGATAILAIIIVITHTSQPRNGV